MLRAALNVHWSQRVTNKELCNDSPKITEIIRYRRLNVQDTYGEMMKKLCTTCFFGCQQIEKTKQKGHQKHTLTKSLKRQDYKWKNLKP